MRLFGRGKEEAETGPRGYLVALKAGPPLLKEGQRELEATWKELAQALEEEWGRPTRLLGDVKLDQPDLSDGREIYLRIAVDECAKVGVILDSTRDSVEYVPAGPTMGFIKIQVNEEA
jgi:hypothetical protein